MRSEQLELSYQEIAQVLGVRPGTVGALLPRVYSKLRDAAGEGIVLSEGTAGAMLGLLFGRAGKTNWKRFTHRDRGH